MNKEQEIIIKELEKEILDTNNIKVSVTYSKGYIVLLCYTTFEKTNEEQYIKIEDEINWTNMKIEKIKEKYSKYFINMELITLEKAKHFDIKKEINNFQIMPKKYKNENQTFGSYIKLKV